MKRNRLTLAAGRHHRAYLQQKKLNASAKHYRKLNSAASAQSDLAGYLKTLDADLLLEIKDALSYIINKGEAFVGYSLSDADEEASAVRILIEDVPDDKIQDYLLEYVNVFLDEAKHAEVDRHSYEDDHMWEYAYTLFPDVADACKTLVREISEQLPSRANASRSKKTAKSAGWHSIRTSASRVQPRRKSKTQGTWKTVATRKVLNPESRKALNSARTLQLRSLNACGNTAAETSCSNCQLAEALLQYVPEVQKVDAALFSISDPGKNNTRLYIAYYDSVDNMYVASPVDCFNFGNASPTLQSLFEGLNLATPGADLVDTLELNGLELVSPTSDLPLLPGPTI